MNPNPFIALEGCDGVGKSTIRKIIARELSRHVPVIEIGQHSWLDPVASRVIIDAREARATFPDGVIRRAYALDKRLHFVNNVTPNQSTAAILADRSVISDAVYQEALYDIRAEDTLESYEVFGIAFPDILVYVSADIDAAVSRIASRGKQRRHYERAADLSRIKSIYERVLGGYLVNTDIWIILFENDLPNYEERTRDEIVSNILDRMARRRAGRSDTRTEHQTVD